MVINTPRVGAGQAMRQRHCITFLAADPQDHDKNRLYESQFSGMEMFSLYFLVFLVNSYVSILAAPLSITPSLGLLSGEIPDLAFPTNSTLRNQSR